MNMIIKFFCRRPLVMKLFMTFLIVIAVVSALSLKRLGFPRVDLGRVAIETIYPGASPEDVELNVTVKVEEALDSLDGIEEYRSSSLENRSRVVVTIDTDSHDPDDVKDDIRRALDRISDFPEEVEDRPRLFEEKIDSFPVYEIGLYSDGAVGIDFDTLRHHTKRLKKKLQKIPEVSRVGEQGVPDREFKILVNRKKMSKYYVSFDEVIDAIQHNKMRVSGGNIESYTTAKGIVTLSEFEQPVDIENIIVRSNIAGNTVKIGDIGKVVDGYKELDIRIRNNGRPGMTLFVIKKGPADIINTVEKVKKEIEKYRAENLPEGLSLVTMLDQAVDTKKRLGSVVSNAIAGFFMVLIVLLLFLNEKVAFWTAVGIPLAVCLALIAMPIFGLTVNSISLVGMVVVLGMLVDDAIIIAESIYTAREAGMEALEAALHGIGEVIMPVIATITTTMLAFFPLYFLPGDAGKFSIEIPSIVVIMLLGSFFEATTFLPAHIALASFKEKKRAPLGQKILKGLEVAYRSSLTYALRNKGKSFFIMAAFLGGSVLFSLKATRFKMFPVGDAFILNIYGETDFGSSLSHTFRMTRELEKIIESLPDRDKILVSFKTQNGIKSPYANESGVTSSNGFTTRIVMKPSNQRDLSAAQLQEFIFERFQEQGLEESLTLDFLIDGGGPPQGKPLEINITGKDDETRRKISQEIMSRLRRFPLEQIDTDSKSGKQETRLIPNYRVISQSQLNVGMIASTIRTAFDGSVVTHLNTSEEQIPFRVELDEESIDFSDPLAGFTIRNKRGTLIPLEKLVTAKASQASESIHHLDGERSIKITANVDLSKTTPIEVRSKIVDLLQEFSKKYPNFDIAIGGEAEKDTETILHLAISIGAAVIAIYFLMVIQFNSFSQPGLVLMGVPFGLAGVLVSFGLHGENLSMLAMVGTLGFSGVVVNDSLIMVEFINRLRRKSTDKDASFEQDIIDGAMRRLRPILLTTVSTVVGLLPTAYGWFGGFDSFLSPMVLAMSWGLLVGTTSILFVVPLLYAANESWVGLFRKLKRFIGPSWDANG